MPPTSSPVGSPKIDVFNPRRLSDRQVEAIATGREAILAELVDTIQRNSQGGAIQHLALVAPRGYGKSFLLRQLRRRVEDLAAQGWPVVYAHLPEELPNVSSVAGLIDEIRRFAAGDLSGGIYHFRDEAPAALAAAEAALDRAMDERFGPGKGLVVAAIENFDELLEKFVRKAARTARRRDGGQPKGKRLPPGLTAGDLTVELALRGVLERKSNRLMLAISATRNIRNDKPAHPLFQWIVERPLAPWTPFEVLTYALRRRRLAKGPDALLSPREQTKLKVLAEFTSGAPRMIAVLVDHLLEQDLDHAALNLSALIDELTPYYKHRMDDLGDECQEVFDALLRGGEPASQTEVAARFSEDALGQGAVAEAFRKLQAERLVVGVREAGGRRKAILYRAADRVMAYWYKQRQVIGHDPAKCGISHFEEAVELLVGWFSRDELRTEAASFARAGRREEAAFLRHISRHGAFRPAFPGDGSTPGRHGPRRHLLSGFVVRLELLLRLLEPAEQAAGREILDAFKSGGSEGLIERLGRESRDASGRWRVFLLCALAVAHALRGATLEREDERAEVALVEALHVAGSDGDAGILVRCLSASLQQLVFGDIEAGIREVEGMDLGDGSTLETRFLAQLNAAWANWHKKDYKTSLQRSEDALESARKLALPAYNSRSLKFIALALHGLGRSEEALEPARQAVQQARLAQDVGQEADTLDMLSWLQFELGRHPESLAEAEQAADRALAAEDFGTASSAFLRQSDCLNALQRPEEALTAARKAEELARTACDLGRENQAALAVAASLETLGRYDETLATAQAIVTRTASCGDTGVRAEALSRAGSALDYLDRKSEAVDALRQALEFVGDNENLRRGILGLLGYCLGELGRHEEAIESLIDATALGARQGSAETRTPDLGNILVFAQRMPETADFAACGPKVLAAFNELADLDAPKALGFLTVVLRIAKALGEFERLEAGLRRAGRKGVILPDTLAVLARELGRIGETTGRARGYAAIVSVLSALEPESDEAAAAADLRPALVRELTLRLSDVGLLRDLADFLEAQDGAAFGTQIEALRGRGLYLESGGESADVERIDPDLVRLYQSMSEIGPLPTRLPQAEDPDLALRPCVVAPVTATSFAGLPLEAASPPTIARFDELAPRLGIANLNEFASANLRAAELPFLSGASLLLLPHLSNGIAIPFVLHSEGLVLAARKDTWIYQLMEPRPPLDLSNDEAAIRVLTTYIRFFFTVVKGLLDGVGFMERASEIPWLAEATEADRERVGAQVKPMVRLDDEGGHAVVRATVMFKNALFSTLVRVQPDGILELTDEELLEENLPIRCGPAEELVISG